MLLAAVTKTVNVVTNLTNVLVYIRNYSSTLSPYAAKKTYSAIFNCYATLRKSESLVALQRLNKIDNGFASVLSEILKVDVSLSYFYMWAQLPLRSQSSSLIFRKPPLKSDRCKTKILLFMAAHKHFTVFLFSIALD